MTGPTFYENRFVTVEMTMRVPDGMTVPKAKVGAAAHGAKIDLDFDQGVLDAKGLSLSTLVTVGAFSQNRYIEVSKYDGGFYAMRVPDGMRVTQSVDGKVVKDVPVKTAGPETKVTLRPYDAKWFLQYYSLVPIAPPTQRQLAAKKHFAELREMLRTLPDTSADKINIDEATEWLNRLTTKAEMGKALLEEGSTEEMQQYYKRVHDVTEQVVSIFKNRISEALDQMSNGEIADRYMGGSKKKKTAKKPVAKKPAAKKATAKKK